MLFKQFLDDDLGCASTSSATSTQGVAVVVDPPYASSRCSTEAEHHGVRLVGVLETHTHADHVSGHGRLALEHGVPIRVHSLCRGDLPARAARRRDRGRGSARSSCARSTRRATGPSTAASRSPTARAATSRGSSSPATRSSSATRAGRISRSSAQEGAEGLFHSLRRLVELGDGVEVFPGHVAGSLCGAAMSSKASTTIGFERRFNPALQGELADFVVGRARPAAAAAAEHGADRRAQPRPTSSARSRRSSGSTRLPTTRSSSTCDRPTAFTAGHQSGRGRDPGVRLELRHEGGVRPARAAPSSSTRPTRTRLCGRRGRLHAVAMFGVAGWQEGGGAETLQPGLARRARAAARGRRGRAARRARGRRARRGAHPRLAASPLPHGAGGGGGGTAQRPPAVTICESGPRAAVAASVLQAAGLDARPVLDGGVADWRGETSSFRRCGS